MTDNSVAERLKALEETLLLVHFVVLADDAASIRAEVEAVAKVVREEHPCKVYGSDNGPGCDCCQGRCLADRLASEGE